MAPPTRRLRSVVAPLRLMAMKPHKSNISARRIDHSQDNAPARPAEESM